MKRKGIVSFLIVILLPITCYYILKISSDSSILMPKKFFYDTILTNRNNPDLEDTIWHQSKNISLVSQLGDTISLYDCKGKVFVVDFIFTHCRSICPVLTRNMSTLQHSFLTQGNLKQKIDTSLVQFVSFTIDSKRDSFQSLKNYADRFNVNHDNWWFLTGDSKKISQFAFEELKVDQFNGQPLDSDFVHTNKFVLLDRNYIVRGFYNGLDTASVGLLARDIGLLMLEKDKAKKGTVFK